METMVNRIEAPSRPGIVLFVAVLNFLTGAASLFASFVMTMALALGNLVGLRQYAADRAVTVAPQIDWAIVLNLTFGFFAATAFVVGVAYILLGVGQLRGRSSSWYFQIAMSVVGLLFVPIGTVINTFILVFFFQPPTRTYFGV